MDREAGMRYRRAVLQPGGSQPEGISLRNFLGRDPNEEAYHRELEAAVTEQPITTRRETAL